MTEREQIERIARGLTKAQRDTMLGHMVEIPPEEWDWLVEQGLKEEMREEEVVVIRRWAPITPRGLAVRDHLKGQSSDR